MHGHAELARIGRAEHLLRCPRQVPAHAHGNNITGAGRQWKREVYPRSGLECHRVRGFIHIESAGNGAVQRFRPGEEAQRKLPFTLPHQVSDCFRAGPAHRRRPLLDAKPPAAKLRRFVRAHDERILCNPLSVKDIPGVTQWVGESRQWLYVRMVGR